MTLYVDKINQFLPLIKTTIEICFIFSLTPWDLIDLLIKYNSNSELYSEGGLQCSSLICSQEIVLVLIVIIHFKVDKPYISKIR